MGAILPINAEERYHVIASLSFRRRVAPISWNKVIDSEKGDRSRSCRSTLKRCSSSQVHTVAQILCILLICGCKVNFGEYPSSHRGSYEIAPNIFYLAVWVPRDVADSTALSEWDLYARHLCGRKDQLPMILSRSFESRGNVISSLRFLAPSDKGDRRPYRNGMKGYVKCVEPETKNISKSASKRSESDLP